MRFSVIATEDDYEMIAEAAAIVGVSHSEFLLGPGLARAQIGRAHV